MFAALPDVGRARLVKLLGMFDAERATAGRLADQFIRERNLKAQLDYIAERPGVKPSA